MTRTRVLLGLATVVALVVMTVIAGYGLFALWFGTCGGDAGIGLGVVVAIAALVYPGTLSTECDPVEQSEECDTY